MRGHIEKPPQISEKDWKKWRKAIDEQQKIADNPGTQSEAEEYGRSLHGVTFVQGMQRTNI